MAEHDLDAIAWMCHEQGENVELVDVTVDLMTCWVPKSKRSSRRRTSSNTPRRFYDVVQDEPQSVSANH